MIKVHKMNIAKINYRKIQNEPHITKSAHLTNVNEISPDVSEPLDLALKTSPAADVLYVMRSSVSIHNGKSARKIVKKNNEI